MDTCPTCNVSGLAGEKDGTFSWKENDKYICTRRWVSPANLTTERGQLTWEWHVGHYQITVYRRLAGTVFGAHFHKGIDTSKNPEHVLFLSGIVHVDLLTKKGTQTSFVIDATENPEEIELYPNVLHRMRALTDCDYIEFRPTPFDPENSDSFGPEEFPHQF